MPGQFSLTGKQWIMRTDFGQEDGRTILSRLFAERKLKREDPLTDPTVFPDIDLATGRIKDALSKNETVGIFGDYDCDGITATALLARYFHRQRRRPEIFLPHRVRDGYGLSRKAVDALAERGVTLLLTVDTGITAVDSVSYARERGMDVVITDHHHVREEIPAAYAILHPRLAPRFLLPFPAGAGVAFSLVQALEGNSEWGGRETDLVLASLGTVADLVELSGGNRTLVKEGLRALNSLSQGPIAALAGRVRSGDRPLTSTDIAFRLAPRINAAGRMDDPLIALEALLEGGKALEALEDLNARRQISTKSLFSEALALLKLPDRFSPETARDLPPLLCAASPSFPEGIIGLIAGKLTEMFGHPSLVASVGNGECTASLRSIPGYNIVEGLERCDDLLSSYGGHSQAAGCTFDSANLDALSLRLSEDIAARTERSELFPRIDIAAILDPRAISMSFCEHLKALEPFGQGNAEPLFLLRSASLNQPRCVGGGGAHLQARIGNFKAIGFSLGHLMERTREPLDVVCKISVDTWNGRRQPQLFIEDIRVPVPAELAVA